MCNLFSDFFFILFLQERERWLFFFLRLFCGFCVLSPWSACSCYCVDVAHFKRIDRCSTANITRFGAFFILLIHRRIYRRHFFLYKLTIKKCITFSKLENGYLLELSLYFRWHCFIVVFIDRAPIYGKFLLKFNSVKNTKKKKNDMPLCVVVRLFSRRIEKKKKKFDRKISNIWNIFNDVDFVEFASSFVCACLIFFSLLLCCCFCWMRLLKSILRTRAHLHYHTRCYASKSASILWIQVTLVCDDYKYSNGKYFFLLFVRLVFDVFKLGLKKSSFQQLRVLLNC